MGEIQDEYDRLPAHITPVGRGWIVGGSASLEQIRDFAGVAFPPAGKQPSATLNEWIAGRLGRPPHGGERIDVDSHKVLVRTVRRHLVQEAQMMPTK